MEIIKVIDLLNKIANKEELPRMVKYDDYILTYDEETQDYYNEPDCTYDLFGDIHRKLNDEVEIIEDTPKEYKISAKDFLDNQFKGLYPKKEKKIEHIAKIYDITDFKNDYPKVAELLNDIANKQYEIIDKVNGE